MPGEVVRQDHQWRLNYKIQADNQDKIIDIAVIERILFAPRSEKTGEK